MADRTLVLTCIARLQAAFPTAKMPKETQMLYAEKMSQLSDDALSRATDDCICRCKKFPSIAEIKERARGIPREHHEYVMLPRGAEDFSDTPVRGRKHVHSVTGMEWDEGEIIGPDGVHRGWPNAAFWDARSDECARRTAQNPHWTPPDYAKFGAERPKFEAVFP